MPPPPSPPPLPPGVDPTDDVGIGLTAVVVIGALSLCCCFVCVYSCRQGWWKGCCKPSGEVGGGSGGVDFGALFAGLLLFGALSGAAPDGGNDVAHLPFLPLQPAASAREGARRSDSESDQL
jgi:hypothetical protein